MFFRPALLLLVAFCSITVLADNLSSGGIASSYWDCCASGSYGGKADVNRPVRHCLKDGVTENRDPNSKTSCGGGPSFTCNDYQPYVSKDKHLSFAFGARSESIGEGNFECACYALKFNQLPGKTLVVQAINDGGDVAPNNFDIQIPGGGVGLFNGCSSQWGAPTNGWGERYGGVSSREQCNTVPPQIRAGCLWKFDWFAGNPTISEIRRVRCPRALTDKSRCIRKDDGKYPDAPLME